MSLVKPEYVLRPSSLLKYVIAGLSLSELLSLLEITGFKLVLQSD